MRIIEVTGGWETFRNKELHNFYSPPNNIRMLEARRMSCTWHVTCTGKKGSAYKVLEGKPEGKNPLERIMHKYGDDIKINI
jgi:hypothetical protein